MEDEKIINSSEEADEKNKENKVSEEEKENKGLHAQILSDLHLEFKGAFDDVENLIPIKSDILILAGDIGNIKFRYYELFFEWAAKNFKHILYVAGNHEYYFHEYNDVQQKMSECLSRFPNVHFLHRKRIEFDDTIFLGVTLWMSPPPPKRQIIQTMYNDFKQITFKVSGEPIARSLRLSDTMKMHEEDIEFLTNELTRIRNERALEGDERKKKKVVIISHHVPLRGLKFLRARERHPLYRDVMYGTCANCSELMLEFFEEIDAWVHGHSHNSLITSYTREQIIEETKRNTIIIIDDDDDDVDDAQEEYFDDDSRSEEINEKSELEQIEKMEKEEKIKNDEEEEKEGEVEKEESKEKKERIWLISNQIGYPHQRDILYQRNFQLSIPPPPALKREEIPEPNIEEASPQSPSSSPGGDRDGDDDDDNNEIDEEEDSSNVQRNHPFSGDSGGGGTGGNKIRNFLSGMKSFLFGDGGGFSEYSNEDPSVYAVKRE